MAPLRAHDLDNGIMVVAAGGVNWNACRLVDDDKVVIFVDYGEGFAAYGGFVAVEGVGNYVAIFYDCSGRDRFAVYYYYAPFNCIFLGFMSE